MQTEEELSCNVPWALSCLLGGSWVVINGVISPLIWLNITVTLLVTPLITTHEPPSTIRTSAGPPTPYLEARG